MNREENRLLLVAGNDSSWANNEHRNLCTASTPQAADGSWPAVPADPTIARAAAKPTSASRFVRTGDWVPLITGDTTRSFKVTKVEYFLKTVLIEFLLTLTHLASASPTRPFVILP